MEKPKLCKLCLTIINTGHFIAIDNTSQEFTYALSFHLNLNDSDKHLVCTSCSTKLLAAYKFKSKCLDVNSRIKSRINTELSGVDLRKSCSEELSTEESVSIPDDQKICYLCLKMISNLYRMIHEVDAYWIQTCIPEVNLSLSKDPVICKECLDSLEIHSNFIQSCLEVNEKTKELSHIKIESNDCNSPLDVYIKEELITKSEEIDNNLSDDFKYQEEINFGATNGISSMEYQYTEEEANKRKFSCEVNIENHNYQTCGNNKKSNQHVDPLEITIYNCVFCSFQTKHKSSFRVHQLKHKDDCGVNIYKCTFCSYESKLQTDIKKHQVTHMDGSEVVLYKCEFCSFETKHKASLRVHRLKHKDKSEVIMYNCAFCPYKSNTKNKLKRHQLIHMNKSEAVMYKCDACSFQTKYRGSMVVHQLLHKDASKVNMYQCEFCSYKSKTKPNLKRHQLIHMDDSDVVIHICDICSYQTKQKNDFKRHELLHKDESEINMYKCEFCSFQTKHKGSLRVHQLTHKDGSDVNMHKCEFCSYESKTKTNLKRHKLTHMDKSEVVVYKCEFCSLQTKYKDVLKRHQLRHKDESEVITT